MSQSENGATGDRSMSDSPLLVLTAPGDISIRPAVTKVTTMWCTWLEGNSLYAIDAHSGTVLLQLNFGAPVPYPFGLQQ